MLIALVSDDDDDDDDDAQADIDGLEKDVLKWKAKAEDAEVLPLALLLLHWPDVRDCLAAQ